MYSYSQALKVADIALESMGLKPIGTVSKYDNGPLDKYQRQATLLLDLIQRKFGVVMNKRFLTRKFTITTVSGKSEYEVPGAFIIEGFKANSFFNITTNGTANRSLTVQGWQQYRESYPDPTLVPTGAPHWVIIPPDDGSGVPKVILCPTPDAAYTLEGQCRLVVQPITTGAQYIVFPQHYEHVLIFKLTQALESKLNEGREVSSAMLADEAVQEVMRDATGAYEDVDPIDFGIRLWGGCRDSTRLPPSDPVPPYP